MSDEIEKKINYKIMTADDLLEGKEVEKKEVQSSTSSEPKLPPQTITEAKDMPVSKEAYQIPYVGEGKGVIKGIPPVQGMEEKAPLLPSELIQQKPIESSKLIESPTTQQTLKSIKKTTEFPQQMTLSEFLKDIKHIFKKQTEIEELEQFPVKFKIPYKIILSIIGILGIILLFIFLKPQEKIKKFSQTPTIQTSTPSISFNLLSPSTSVVTSSEMLISTLTPITSEATETTSTVSLATSTFGVSGELISLKNIETKIIQVKELSVSEFEKALKQLLVKQEYPASIFSFNFVFQEKPLVVDYFYDYFIKPKNLSSEELKDNLSGQYTFILYYSYTRKDPIIIFKVENPDKVKSFNQDWEKKGMANDLKTLFFDTDPGKPLSGFTSKKLNNISYRIVNFKNNYQLIWLIDKDYLIYTTSENGLKKVISDLP